MVDVADGWVWLLAWPSAPFYPARQRTKRLWQTTLLQGSQQVVWRFGPIGLLREFVAGQDLSIADIAIFPDAHSLAKVLILMITRMWCVKCRMLINRPAFLTGAGWEHQPAETKDMTENAWLDQFSAVNAN